MAKKPYPFLTKGGKFVVKGGKFVVLDPDKSPADCECCDGVCYPCEVGTPPYLEREQEGDPAVISEEWIGSDTYYGGCLVGGTGISAAGLGNCWTINDGFSLFIEGETQMGDPQWRTIKDSVDWDLIGEIQKKGEQVYLWADWTETYFHFGKQYVPPDGSDSYICWYDGNSFVVKLRALIAKCNGTLVEESTIVTDPDWKSSAFDEPGGCPGEKKEHVFKDPKQPAIACKETSAMDNPAPKQQQGVGTQLKTILGWFFIRPKAGCQCNDRAKVMDENGPQWCRDNLETIVGWLREEAENRRLPFIEFAARQAVLQAINWADAQRPTTQT